MSMHGLLGFMLIMLVAACFVVIPVSAIPIEMIKAPEPDNGGMTVAPPERTTTFAPQPPITINCGPNNEYSNIVQCMLRECPILEIIECTACLGCLDPGGPTDPSCVDLPANSGADPWDNGSGATCQDFENNPTWCDLFGDSTHPADEGTANEKCCTCGGGLQLGLVSEDGKATVLLSTKVMVDSMATTLGWEI